MASETFIIDDGSPDRFTVEPAGMSRGLDLSARPDGYAYAGLAEPFPDELLIPRHEWQARVEEQEERQTHLQALCDRAGLPIKNQRSTNYCWFFGPVRALEIIRLIHHLPVVSLSPASGAAQLTGYRNRGGWGKDALEWIVEHGVCPSSMWPDAAIDRRYATAEAKAAALDYRVTEWWELEPRNLDQYVSCLLHGIPVTVGRNFMRHQLCSVRAVWRNGQIGVLDDNSWGYQWGDGGRVIFQGSKMLPDDAIAPRVAIAM